MPPQAPRRSSSRGSTSFKVSTEAQPDFKGALEAYVFNPHGELLKKVAVKAGKLTVPLSKKQLAKSKVFLLPKAEDLPEEDVTPARLRRLGAYEPVLQAGREAKLIDHIRIPGPIIACWPLCFCIVRGRVVRHSDGLPICDARVHICEVDRLPFLIAELADRDIFRLRDDIIDLIKNPPIPEPDFPPFPPGPGPDPFKPVLRVAAPTVVEKRVEISPRVLAERAKLSAEIFSPSVEAVRTALIQDYRIILPYLCWLPWWRLRCDEIAVVTTDAHGRFSRLIPYCCNGDRPDLYFWVEYDFGNGPEVVYRPSMRCTTRWNYPCGSEITIRVTNPRVPGCHEDPNLEGKQVWIVSVGRTVSIGEILTSAAGTREGLVQENFLGAQRDFAFGGKLEPRVWFGGEALKADGITHYLWSVRKVGTLAWTPLTRQVIRHYMSTTGTGPVEPLGPEGSGNNAGRFQIPPLPLPAGGLSWEVADEREDLATAHFVTQTPAALPASDPAFGCGVADPDAGKYELKFELFKANGDLVDWDAEGIQLRIATNEAPFGTNPVQTAVASNYNRIRDAGQTKAFRMVLHVDNSRSGADIDPISGSGITVDPACGVVTLTGANPTINASFDASRPGGLARFVFNTRRGLSTDIAQASTTANVDDASAPATGGNFTQAGCGFAKSGIPVSDLLGGCPQGAFAETVRVYALTVDGYSRRSGLDASDVSAFMLTTPCPPCECEDEEPDPIP